MCADERVAAGTGLGAVAAVVVGVLGLVQAHRARYEAKEANRITSVSLGASEQGDTNAPNAKEQGIESKI
jgi:galactokinase/mevalonate kinase-like predicted kinase